jgi:hypothetical protein
MKKPINEIERLKLIAGLINEINYNDSVYGVKRTTLTEGKKKKEVKELSIDVANPYEYRMGLQYELEQMDDYSNESLEKAKSIVLKNLAKDVNFYTTLLNQDQSPYKFEAPETDKPGMQAKADGYLKKELKKDAKANVQDTLGKKEAGKKKPKGVKVMPDKGVTGSEKTIKENLINEVILKVYHYDPSSGDLEDVDVEYFSSEEEAKKAALAHHWQIAFDNGDTDLSKEDFISQTNFDDFEPYNNYDYKIVSDKGNIKEGLEVTQDDNQIHISADSGDYSGFVEKDGKVSFSLDFEFDMDRIEDEFGEEGITDDNWRDVLGPDHAFVKIIDKIGGDIEAAGDYVMITVDADKLKSIKEGLEEASKDPHDKAKVMKVDGKFEVYTTQDGEIKTFDKEADAKAFADKYNSENVKEGSFMGGVDLGASFDKMKGQMNAEEEFNSLMSKYDWYYEMSDDPRAYDRGTAMNSKLKMLGKQIGVDKAIELFNSKAPSDRKITSSFFMEGEDKHSKIKEALKAALKKALKEEDPAMARIEKDEEAAEKALAQILTKKAAVLAKPGTQG